MERVLKVIGKSNISVEPDCTRINLRLSHVEKEYADCMKRSVTDLNVVVECIKEFGFARKDLKTKYFDINKKTDRREGRNGEYRNYFVGYEYIQTLTFYFKNDNELLGKVLYALAHLSIQVEVSISYFAKNVEDVKNQLLEIAVQDAIKKAKILAKASNVVLCEIVDIDYSWVSIRLESEDYNIEDASMLTNAKCCSYDLDIQPEEIAAGDSVKVTFRIE